MPPIFGRDDDDELMTIKALGHCEEPKRLLFSSPRGINSRRQTFTDRFTRQANIFTFYLTNRSHNPDLFSAVRRYLSRYFYRAHCWSGTSLLEGKERALLMRRYQTDAWRAFGDTFESPAAEDGKPIPFDI